ncbi:substrate-binding domain-containing protein [Streptomyces sp. TRM66268-LWL]|uniref:Substrate-binding domain-containing protein n=1 Tax=Streptomyces polyasparticus TaxID=2767826 RepID=A0ABR7ST99_9ACTN|nr:substrate-binding domain-containing protein [Streptomyces polyasparticus]MBC9717568.1 substrate-binding domain-containing protein [Streptomyces polyasparticus]
MRESVASRRKRMLAAVLARGEVGLRELAAELGVSTVTTRRDAEALARAGALRRSHGVVRALGTPAVHATGAEDDVPRTAPGGSVALVVPELHSYLNEAMHGARHVLEAAGLQVVVYTTPRAAVGTEQPLVECALAEGTRGLIIAPRWHSASAEDADGSWLNETGVPTVLLERRPGPDSPLYALDSVCSDHRYGMQLAIDHLLALGHRRLLLAVRNDSPTARAVRAAYKSLASTRTDIAYAGQMLSSPDAGPGPGASGGTHDLPSLLVERDATAVIAHSDADAVVLVQQLIRAGIRVPEDCSVIAYDDVVASLAQPPLTAVAPPKAEVGRAAAELLLRRLTAPAAGPARRVELLPGLIMRGSTARLG